MNDDFINNVTLNCLISSQQLIKLKQKEQIDKCRGISKDMHKEQLLQLFVSLLDDEPPENILSDVTDSFDYFIQKSIYYFKLVEQSNMFNEEDVGVDKDVIDEIDEDVIDEDVIDEDVIDEIDER